MIVSTLFLASCGARTDDNNTLKEKKEKLADLKKQQQKLETDIATLQAEILKLDPSAAPERAKLVAIQAVTPSLFTHYIDLQGTVESENISYVAPRNGQGGLVKAVYVKQGDDVRKGQQLLKLDDAVYLKNLRSAETELEYAQDLYRRQKNLWDQQIGTEYQLVQAKQRVDQAQNSIATIKEQWSMTNIYADVNGIADMVNIKVGEFFTGGPQQIRIVNNTDLKITTQVPENYMDRVKQGSNIRVSFPDLNKTIDARISVTGKIIDPVSRSFYVEAKLPHDGELKPNQIAIVRIQDYRSPEALVVPVNTVQTDEKGKFVLVAVTENGRLIARKKAVQIGEMYDDKIEIKSGLQAGDQVITEGFQGLYDGQLLTTSAG